MQVDVGKYEDMDVQKTTENDPLENMGTKDEDDETRSWRQENAEIDMLG